MKKTLLTIFAATLSLSLTAQTIQRTEWGFSSKHTAHFIEHGCYHASIGKGEIEFVGKKATLTVGNKKKSYPAAEGTRKGDYWLMSVPVQNIKAGTAVDLWFPFIAEPADDRYAFAFEYLDGKEWKAVVAGDNKGVNCYSSKSDKWPNFLWHTIRLENAIKSGNLLVRLRHCDKVVTKSTLYGSGVSTAPKVIVLGDQKPKDVTRVLFIGNSYTYYNHYPMMLKEIAWHEGHELECGYYTHGGYTMKQHLADHVRRAGTSHHMMLLPSDRSILLTADTGGLIRRYFRHIEHVGYAVTHKANRPDPLDLLGIFAEGATVMIQGQRAFAGAFHHVLHAAGQRIADLGDRIRRDRFVFGQLGDHARAQSRQLHQIGLGQLLLGQKLPEP